MSSREGGIGPRVEAKREGTGGAPACGRGWGRKTWGVVVGWTTAPEAGCRADGYLSGLEPSSHPHLRRAPHN